MDLAMVKQEQGETLRKYMRRFFDKRFFESTHTRLFRSEESRLEKLGSLQGTQEKLHSIICSYSPCLEEV
jgi:hypothetical protein